MAIDMPDWNELPENIRREFVQSVEDELGQGCGGDVALAFYALFAKRLGEFWPEWRDRKRREAASRDMFEDGA